MFTSDINVMTNYNVTISRIPKGRANVKHSPLFM